MNRYAAASGLAPAGQTRPLELLERALSWGRPVLATASGCDLTASTPCTEWDVRDLLVHLVDGFTAFIQGAAGAIPVPAPPPPPRDPQLLTGHLLDLGCGVLSEWAGRGRRGCAVGPAVIPADTVLEVAALEIAIHGWDLASACTSGRQLPPGLAAALLPLALRHVGPGERPGRFGPVVRGARRDPGAVLLSHLGRHADPR